eukprot:scaffold114080_cov36-Phaeocystis_antarctica.AAC.1
MRAGKASPRAGARPSRRPWCRGPRAVALAQAPSARHWSPGDGVRAWVSGLLLVHLHTVAHQLPYPNAKRASIACWIS